MASPVCSWCSAERRTEQTLCHSGVEAATCGRTRSAKNKVPGAHSDISEVDNLATFSQTTSHNTSQSAAPAGEQATAQNTSRSAAPAAAPASSQNDGPAETSKAAYDFSLSREEKIKLAESAARRRCRGRLRCMCWRRRLCEGAGWREWIYLFCGPAVAVESGADLF